LKIKWKLNEFKPLNIYYSQKFSVKAMKSLIKKWVKTITGHKPVFKGFTKKPLYFFKTLVYSRHVIYLVDNNKRYFSLWDLATSPLVHELFLV